MRKLTDTVSPLCWMMGIPLASSAEFSGSAAVGEQEAKSEQVAEVDEQALAKSRKDARVLLWFATREGTKVKDEVLADIVKAETELRSADAFRSCEIEAKFWKAYRDLAAAVKPASVDSILSTCRHPFGKYVADVDDPSSDNPRKWNFLKHPWRASGRWALGDARQTKRRYTTAAVVVLVVLLLVQTYWFVVSTFSANLEKHRDELDSIAGALRLMSVISEQAKHTAEAKDATTDWGKNTQVLDLIKRDVTELLVDRPILSALVLTRPPDLQLVSVGFLDLQNKAYRKRRLISMIRNEMAVLQEPWRVFWYLFMQPVVLDQKNRQEPLDSKSYSAPNNMGDKVGEGVGFHEAMTELNERIKVEEAQIGEIMTDERLEKTLSRSKSIPTILSQYFLPMLYGLLGALTYIIRSLSREIYDVTYTRVSATRYSLRWPLGMLAGVTVGLFFDPTQFSGFEAITPLGIAFLAGYGVELFFTALDALVRVFTRNSGGQPKAEVT